MRLPRLLVAMGLLSHSALAQSDTNTNTGDVSLRTAHLIDVQTAWNMSCCSGDVEVYCYKGRHFQDFLTVPAYARVLDHEVYTA